MNNAFINGKIRGMEEALGLIEQLMPKSHPYREKLIKIFDERMEIYRLLLNSGLPKEKLATALDEIDKLSKKLTDEDAEAKAQMEAENVSKA